MTATFISLLSGLGGMFGWGIYDFLAGVYAKNIGPFKTFFWSQLAGLVFAVLLMGLYSLTLDIPAVIIVYIGAAVLCYAAGYLLFMRGFEIGNISIVAAIMNLWAVFTMLIAFVFMGQRLTVLQSAGVLMIISGATLAALNRGDLRDAGLGLSAGVKETVLGAFFFGVFWNISEVVTESIGWLPTTLFVKVGIILLLLVLSVLMKREIILSNTTPQTKWMLLLMGILEAGAVAVVNFGLSVGDAILITPIASALSVVTITMAVVFLREKITKLQGLGIITAVSGIILTGL
jgi:transporter family protein